MKLTKYITYISLVGALFSCLGSGKSKLSSNTPFNEDDKTAKVLQSIRPSKPSKNNSTIKDLQLNSSISKDLKIRLWASSELIDSPIAMDVDAVGRVWVTEDYSRKKGRIVVLSDTTKDGYADKRQVFLENKFLRTSTSLAIFDNKVYVANHEKIIIYTDVNKNGVFDKLIDKEEIFSKGFETGFHDHGLHSFLGLPNGELYFDLGNRGGTFKFKDGRQFSSASYYGNPRNTKNIGKKSWDGRTYIGGMSLRMNSDGSNARVISHNNRNVMDAGISSFGDIFQADQDDPPNSRASWLLPYANYGYASFDDGGRRTWSEIAKSWDGGGQKKNGIVDLNKRGTSNRAHWRENYPGTSPIGYSLGVGSPIGAVFIENDDLSKELMGSFIFAECVRREFLHFKPEIKGTHYDMKKVESLIKLKVKGKLRSEHFSGKPFFPIDVTMNIDGSLFLADWVSSIYRRFRGLKKEGGIYRISKKSEKYVKLPKFDFTTTKGLLKVLMNPAINVRWVAFNKLTSKGSSITNDVIDFYKKQKNPYHRARLIWLLAKLGKEGRNFVLTLINHKDVRFSLVSYRALVDADPKNIFSYIKKFLPKSHLFVKQAIAISLRDIDLKGRDALISTLFKSYDGNNRYYLEALGAMSNQREEFVYNILLKNLLKKEFKNWTDKEMGIAWRLRTKLALRDLFRAMKYNRVSLNKFRFYLNAFALYFSEKERLINVAFVKELSKLPKYKAYKSTIDEFMEKDFIRLKPIKLDANYIIPKQFGKKTKVGSIDTILKLKGDAKKGKLKFQQSCLTCHVMNGVGVHFGPNLTGWGKVRSYKAIMKEILKPSSKLAHGYSRSARITNGKYTAEGLVIGHVGHSHTKGTYKLKIFGGSFKKFELRKNRYKINFLKESLMPKPENLGLTNQDIRNITEFLKKN